ncbi:MAG: KpsF/GutQ family sugar-phosphate isomerase [Ginsengibacter sp.]
MTPNKIISSAKKTIELEARAIRELADLINENFEKAVQIISKCKGRVVISGIGKSAIVAQKIVATLNSTGTAALFLHAADAIHGDIGMVQQDDVVLIISKSGDSPEIKVLIPLIKNFKNIVIGMTGNVESYLGKFSDLVLSSAVSEEACPNNLAPTSSSTAQIVLGDAIAICLMEVKGFKSVDFAKFHPGGTLGKKLYLRVGELSLQNEKPAVQADSFLKEVIIEMTRKRLGVTVVLDKNKKLSGIITDGDLRRMLEKQVTLDKVQAKDIMTPSPKTISTDDLAVTALETMREKNITQLVVTRDGVYSGIIHLHDLVREGII